MGLIKVEKIAEYQRVSSGGQDLEMQESANKPYIKEADPNNILKFVDYDVSATKIDFRKRPALNRLLDFIRQGNITKVIVYDRDRLARDVFEYIHILKEFNKYNVVIIFTASNVPAYSNDLFLETWFGLQAQFEGQRIQARLFDARKRNPPSLIGYEKLITDNKKRYYKPNIQVSDQINSLFEDFSHINSPEELYELVIKYKQFLSRTEDRIIDILKTPFYAASFIDASGNFQSLDHVEPIITIELFKKVQKKLNFFEKYLNQGFSITTIESKIIPTCGICNNLLTFKKGELGQPGLYKCKSHKKVQISVEELNLALIDANRETLKKLSHQKIEIHCIKQIDKLISNLNNNSLKLQNTLEQNCIFISKKYNPKKNYKKIDQELENVDHLIKEINGIQVDIENLQKLKSDVKKITEIIKHNLVEELNDSEQLVLSELLTSKLIIHHDFLTVEHYFNDFIVGENK